jgi:hypothetical protein
MCAGEGEGMRLSRLMSWACREDNERMGAPRREEGKILLCTHVIMVE